MSRRIETTETSSESEPKGVTAPEDEDKALVEAAKTGSEQAYSELFEKYQERIYRIAYRYVRDKDKALDLCQETFIKAFQSVEKFRSDSKFYTWLCRIAYNTCIDYLRSRAARHGGGGELNEEILNQEKLPHMNRSIEPRPSAKAEEAELREKLDTAMEQLPEAQRSVFVLHVMEELPYKEIAVVMNCSIGTVMSRLHYARQKLQGLMKHYLVSPES